MSKKWAWKPRIPIVPQGVDNILQGIFRDPTKVTDYNISGKVSGKGFAEDSRNKIAEDLIISKIDNSVPENSFWRTLNRQEKLAYLNNNYKVKDNGVETMWGLQGDSYSFDTDSVISDLNKIAEADALEGPQEAPVYDVPTYDQIYNEIDAGLANDYDLANARITEALNRLLEEEKALDEYRQTSKDNAQALYDDQLAALDAETERANAMYADQMEGAKDSMDTELGLLMDSTNMASRGILSNQYMANAQTYDALSSDLRKSRQNALEAGASAGIRLAGNVNALLTAQNKQSQTSLETSNQLAQMLLNQRQAAAGIRNDYSRYMDSLNNANYNRLSDIDSRRSGYGSQFNNSILGIDNYYGGRMSDLNSQRAGFNNNRTNLNTQRRNETSDRAHARLAEAQTDYDTRMNNWQSNMNNWHDNYSNTAGATNPFANAAMAHRRNQRR